MSEAPRESERRVLHAATAAAGLCLLVPDFNSLARIALAIIAALAIVAEFARRRFAPVRSAVDRAGVRWLRPDERASIAGSTWLALGYAATAVIWPGPVAGRAVAVAALSDPAASAVGRRFARASGRKTTAGSAAAFASAGVVLLAIGLLSGEGAGAEVPVAALVAAAAERVPWRGLDNLLIAPATAAALGLLA